MSTDILKVERNNALVVKDIMFDQSKMSHSIPLSTGLRVLLRLWPSNSQVFSTAYARYESRRLVCHDRGYRSKVFPDFCVETSAVI